MSYELSAGALETIMKGGTFEKPVMQILGSKKMTGVTSADRYRLLISDGCYVNSFAMLATQLNDMILSGELSDYTVIRIDKLVTSMVGNAGKGNKRVMIILELSVLAVGNEVGIRIGNPVPYEEVTQAERPIIPPPAVKRPSPPPPANQRASPAKRPMTSPSGGSSTNPIASLNPYQNRWTIKARVTAKTPIKTWSNVRGEGKLFSMDLIDESGEIRCTGFKEAVDKFYEMIEIGKVYCISNCGLKTANKQFTHIKHDYEMSFHNGSIVEPCHEETSIPSISFDFAPLESIQSLEDKSTCDIIGICQTASDLQTILAKTSGKQFIKRDVTLVDESGSAVSLALWGSQAVEFNCTNSPVMALKGVSVRDFGGVKTLSCMTSTVMQINPDIPQSHRLRGWYENTGVNQEFSMPTGSGGGLYTTKLMTLREMKTGNLGSGIKADFLLVKATIFTTRHDKALYLACTNNECNKKVIEQGNGMYRCEKCNLENDSFKYRLLTTFNVGDHTTNSFVQSFQDTAEVVLGMTAQELGELEASDPDKYQEVFAEANFKSFVFKLRVKMETYNDSTRQRATIYQVQKPINYKEYNAHLISEIKRLHKIEKVEK